MQGSSFFLFLNLKKRRSSSRVIACFLSLPSIEQMATLIRFIELSLYIQRQFMTSLAQRNRSKATSCRIRSEHIVSSTFFWSCWCWGNSAMASKSTLMMSFRTRGCNFCPSSVLLRLKRHAVAAIWMAKTVLYSKAAAITTYHGENKSVSNNVR